MPIKENDFVELDYTGKVKESGMVFDTTQEDVAKKNEFYNEKHQYAPVIICVGRGQLLKGLDKHITGKEVDKTYKIELKPEEAFGKKSAELIQLVPTAKFTKEKIRPEPGLQVQIDDAMGVIKTVSGGRTLVDFNHPLAGKELEYEIKMSRVITDLLEKVKAFLKIETGMEPEVQLTEKDAEITFPIKAPEEVKERLTALIKNSIPGLGKVTYKVAEAKQ
ncbi:MAG: peptidylprolyl isomerase [Nanoarchaeota archaeon]|nr:peptidylprolyl isomerase [Nanoarchaeota archaeon]